MGDTSLYVVTHAYCQREAVSQYTDRGEAANLHCTTPIEPDGSPLQSPTEADCGSRM